MQASILVCIVFDFTNVEGYSSSSGVVQHEVFSWKWGPKKNLKVLVSHGDKRDFYFNMNRGQTVNQKVSSWYE